MDFNNYFELGSITKTFGIKGELVIYLDTDTPNRYSDLNEIFVFHKGELINKKILTVRLKQNLAFVSIEGITSIEQAEVFVKSKVFLPLNELPKLNTNEFFIHDVIGYEGHEKNKGHIGTIMDVLDYPTYRLFKIKTEKGEILIPVNPDFIEKIDKSGKILHFTTPEGYWEAFSEETKPIA